MRPRRSIAACVCVLSFAGPADARPAAEEEPPPTLEPGPTVLDLTLGLAFMSRKMEVQVAGSDGPRTYSAPGFLELTVGGEFHPLAPLDDWASGLGIFITYRHHFLLLATTGPTDLGESIEVDTAEQELLAGALFRVPLRDGPASPSITLSLGGGFFEFALDPQAMSLLKEDVQMPTMSYKNIAGTVAASIPFGTPSIGFEGSLTGRWVLDVGQAARDLLGADTKGGSGFDVWAGLGGRFLGAEGLHWSVSGGLTIFNTELSGATTTGDGVIDGFPGATDRYLRLLVLMGYAFH
ncbi:MAG: hypothetical protein HYY06_00790 [Deltaproteobacteria bacterium]|nr:hypothetical protein [Deltaproteobacteria bacterium]